MARPIESIAPFEGKAADWLVDYLDKKRPDPQKQKEQEARDEKLLAHVMEPRSS